MKKLITTLLLTFLIISPLYAYSQETATSHAYYEHPVTGVIEDSGNNAGIGQGMCENILYEKALIEEVDNKFYACVRYSLTDSIREVSFAVQNRGEKNFIAKSYEVVKEGDDTKDYRFEIPSKDVIVRSTFFVEAMGRNVVFYFDFSDYVEGNTDFIPLGEKGKMQNLINSDLIGEDGTSVEVKAVNDLIEAGDLGYEHGLLMKDSPEIKAIYGSSNDEPSGLTQLDAAPKANGEWGFISKTLFQSLMILLVLLAFFLIISAIILYFASKHLKNVNSIREAAIYEEE